MNPLFRIAVRATPLAVVIAAALWSTPAGLIIDYPAQGTLFPSDITAPTFLWRDSSRATSWRIRISFPEGAPAVFTSAGPHVRVGEIDPDCVSTTNEPPTVNPAQRTWKPDAAVWETIKQRSRAGPATMEFTGLAGGVAVSKASVRIQTSTDPVGAPIFYRDVPLMPTETEPGVIKPLAPYAIRLVKWRVRNISQSSSRVVMENLPVCANCHSFSANGRYMGMDLDGLKNNKGRYFLAPIEKQVNVRRSDVIQWTTSRGRLENPIRVGFMSQVSPDGSTVVTTIDPPGNHGSNYYVANFTDYRFLQVFFPTRGILAWYRKDTGMLQPLPGADDPAHVQFGAVWSPDGQYLIFARAAAQDPRPPHLAMAKFANDPNELQIKYDLYRIPFRNGRGGVAEPIAGASQNGMSNTFPKISPDGRWLVWVQSRNGQLMRPDSRLWIVPATGGEPRPLRANTPRMNSWHSFSPNGRWLVFSSKVRSPYTQMYLTHIDADGNDTPPVLVENTTAANRAVNIPEFVNITPDRLQAVTGPAIDYYRLYDRALYLQKQRRYGESAEMWKKLVDIAPDDTEGNRRLGMTLLLAGRRTEALPYLEKAKADADARTPLARAIQLLESGQEPPPVQVSTTPGPQEHYYLALVALRHSDRNTALEHLRQAIALNADYAEAHQKLAENTTDPSEALAHWREAIRIAPNNATALRRAAWILATNRKLQDGPEAQAMAVRALLLTGSQDPATLDTLAAAYAENDRFEDAVATAQRAIAAGPSQAGEIRRRIECYKARTPWRE